VEYYMKKLLAIVLLVTAGLAQAWEQRAPLPPQACQVHSPYGFAQTARTAQPICREAYLVAYDAPVKIPVYVAYTLLPQNALGCFPRTNAFVADQSLGGTGARPDDYAGTGYDKGHMSPDGDLSWTQQVEYESFLMTNMVPQRGSLNRGIWKLLETSVRGWAVQLNQPFTIYVGSIYNNEDKRIGNGVIVPHAYYKIVINNQTKQVAGWLFPHVEPYPNLGNDLTVFRKPIADIMNQAGVKYAFPTGAIELQPGQEWPVNYGALTQAKRNKCGANASAD
jgi:DNA/RNA endonuclease G (NUC1)